MKNSEADQARTEGFKFARECARKRINVTNNFNPYEPGTAEHHNWWLGVCDFTDYVS